MTLFLLSRRAVSLCLTAVLLAASLHSVKATPPAEPTNARVSFSRAGMVSTVPAVVSITDAHTYALNWTDNANDESGYRLDLRIGNVGPFQTVQFLPQDSQSTYTTITKKELLAKDVIVQFRVIAYKMHAGIVEASAAPIIQHVVTDGTGSMATPTNFQVTKLFDTVEEDGRLRLSWNAAGANTNALFHQVVYRKSGDQNYTHLNNYSFSLNDVIYEHEYLVGLDGNPVAHKFEPGSTYEFFIRSTRRNETDQTVTPIGGSDATYNLNNTAYSAPVVVTIPSVRAPTALTATAVDETTVRLSWRDNSSNESSYQIETKLPSESTFTVLASNITANRTTQNVTTDAGTTREWRVRALFKKDANATTVESSATEVATSTTPFLAPSDFTAVTSPVAGAVDIEWKDNSKAETLYVIETRLAGSGDFETAAIVPSDTTRARVSLRTQRTGNTITGTTPLELYTDHDFRVSARTFRVSGTTQETVDSAPSSSATTQAKDGFTSRLYQPATAGQTFSYQLTTSSVAGSPVSRSITGLPPGLSYDDSVGTLTGTPTVSGLYKPTLSVSYSNTYTATTQLDLRILRSPGPPTLGLEIPDVVIGVKTPFRISLADKFNDPESETAVRFETTRGNIDILLYPSLVPLGVQNFLDYVTSGRYNGVAFHRSIPGFILQGGGFRPVQTPNVFNSVSSLPSPLNEPGISNVSGTIASAKRGAPTDDAWALGNPNSASNDFFFNLANNNSSDPQSLDNQNGGFTAFGRLTSPSISVVDGIAALPRGVYTQTQSADNRVVVDGVRTSFPEYPIDASTAPTTMDVRQSVFINEAYVIPALNYSVVTVADPSVITAEVIGDQLQVTGIKPGVSNLTVQLADLDGTTPRSQTFQVTVRAGYQGPVITRQPLAQAVIQGARATLTVSATGTALQYQWRKDGQVLTGETKASLIVPSVQLSHVGSYDVVVSNENSSVTSVPARIDFRGAPLITQHPVSKIVEVGSPLELNAAATGAPVPAFAWSKDGRAVAGQTKPKLLITAAKLTDGGVYTAKATNVSGNQATTSANVVVVDKITKLITSLPNRKVTLVAPITGPGLTYQWRKGTNTITDIPSATNSTLVFNSVQSADSDIYSCRVNAAGLGSVDTGNLKLAVVARPVLPESFNAANGVVGFDYDFVIPFDTALTNTPTNFQTINLPAGLVINKTTGRITGRPTKPGRFRFVVAMQNAAGNSNHSAGFLEIFPLPVDAVGVFQAGIEPHSTLNANRGGRLDLTIADTAAFTAKVTLGKDVYSVRGALTYFPGLLDPVAEVVIPRKGLPNLILRFQIEPNGGWVTGQISDGNVLTSLSGFRQVFNLSYNPTYIYSPTKPIAGISPNLARIQGDFLGPGIYNVGFNLPTSSVNLDSVPQGTGFATITTGYAGTATMVGRLSDGTLFTTSSNLSRSNGMILFQMLYANTGSIYGNLSFSSFNIDPRSTPQQNQRRVGGQLRWLKDPQIKATERNYRSGFGPLSLSALGMSYYPPASGQIVADLINTPNNARLLFTGAKVDTAALEPDIAFSIFSNNYSQLPAAGSPGNPAKTTFLLYPSTGSFTGRFELTDGTVKRAVTYQGLIIPTIPNTPEHEVNGTAAIAGAHASAAGYFLLPQLPTTSPPTTINTSPILSGKVSLTPAPIVINPQPISRTVNPNASVTFTVTATGQGTLTYQWRKDGVNLVDVTNKVSGATTNTLTLTGVTNDNEGTYTVLVSNTATSLVSDNATLAVNDVITGVTLVRSPATAVLAPGTASVVFTPTVAGATSGLTYAWFKDNNPISGATGSTFTLTNPTTSDNGSYTCTVSNVIPSSATSNPVNLTIAEPITSVTVTRTPSDSQVNAGTQVQFTAIANGTSPTYQWYKDGNAISGQTSSTLTIDSPTESDDGGYYVRVSNAATSNFQSDTVSLDIVTPP